MQAPRVLRPLGLLEIIDQTFRLYRGNFWLLVGIAGLVYLPMGLLQAIPDIGPYIAIGFLLLGLPLAGGAMVQAVSERYLGRSISLEGSYRAMLRRLLWLYLTALLVYALYLLPVGLPAIPSILAFAELTKLGNAMPSDTQIVLLVVGLPLLLVSGVLSLVLFPWLPFTLSACVLEGKNHLRALTRATFLLLPWVWGLVLAVTLIVYLLTAILQLVLTAPTQVALIVMLGKGAMQQGQWHPLLLLNGLLTGIAGAVCLPLTVGVYVLLYYDAKIRKEGYDLQLLAQELEDSVSAEPVLPARAEAPAQAPETPPTDG